MTMKEIEGSRMIDWVLKAGPSERRLLKNQEYADDNFVWSIKDVDELGFLVLKDDETKANFYPYKFFRDGVFYLEDEVGESIEKLLPPLVITPADEALTYLTGKGFSRTGLTHSFALTLAEVIRNFEENSAIPDFQQWNEFRDEVTQCPLDVMRCSAPYVEKFVAESEKRIGLTDFSRRVLLAVLYRHTGQFQKALLASQEAVTNSQHSGDRSVPVLCTTRAATQMDVAEAQGNKSLLSDARASLNKARAMTDGNSKEIMNCYFRLKKLDARAARENWV